MQKMTSPYALLFIVIAAAACSSPPTNLYLIDDRGERSPALSSQGLPVVGLEKVDLPSYAQDERVISRGANHRLIADDNNRWAEPPEESLTRVLALKLGRELNALPLTEPFLRGADLSLRIAVTLDTFILNEDGEAEMSGQTAILSPNGRDVLAIERFAFKTKAASGSAGDYASAIEADLQKLSTSIAASARAHLNKEESM